MYGCYKKSLSEDVTHPLIHDVEALGFLFSKLTEHTGLAISSNRYNEWTRRKKREEEEEKREEELKRGEEEIFF